MLVMVTRTHNIYGKIFLADLSVVQKNEGGKLIMQKKMHYFWKS